MREINIRETTFTPDKPNVIANEQLEVYMPTAGYETSGVSSFTDDDFIVEPNGHVHLRRSVTRAVANFSVDWELGILYINYDDGTNAELAVPTKTDALYNRYNLINEILFGPSAFSITDADGRRYALFDTGFDDDKFFVSLEMSNTQTVDGASMSGYTTVMDSIHKGDDGSVLLCVDSEADAFEGRLILVGGSVFTDTQIVNITFDADNNKFIVTKADGTEQDIEAVSKEFVVDRLQALDARKQDTLSFDGSYSPVSNKVATVSTVSTKIAEVIAGAPESLDTLKEIADWIDEHPKSVTELTTQIQANADKIDNMPEYIDGNSSLKQAWIDWLNSLGIADDEDIVIVDIFKLYDNNDFDMFYKLSDDLLAGRCVVIGKLTMAGVGVNAMVTCVLESPGNYMWRGFSFDYSDNVITNVVLFNLQNKGDILTLDTVTQPLNSGGATSAVIVDINELITTQDCYKFTELSDRFSNGECVIICKLGDQYAVLDGIAFNGNDILWSGTAFSYIPNDGNGFTRKYLTCFAIDCIDGEYIIFRIDDTILDDTNNIENGKGDSTIQQKNSSCETTGDFAVSFGVGGKYVGSSTERNETSRVLKAISDAGEAVYCEYGTTKYQVVIKENADSCVNQYDAYFGTVSGNYGCYVLTSVSPRKFSSFSMSNTYGYTGVNKGNASLITGTKQYNGAKYSFVTGTQNIVGDNKDNTYNNAVYGSFNIVKGAKNSLVGGKFNTVIDGQHDVVLGNNNTVNDAIDSIVGGRDNNATSFYNSIAVGTHLTVSGESQAVFGTHNSNKEDTLLEVGNGKVGAPSNAFEVYKDGRVAAANKFLASEQYVNELAELIQSGALGTLGNISNALDALRAVQDRLISGSVEFIPGLPKVDDEDNGKFLQVVNGKWSSEQVATAEMFEF